MMKRSMIKKQSIKILMEFIKTSVVENAIEIGT